MEFEGKETLTGIRVKDGESPLIANKRGSLQ